MDIETFQEINKKEKKRKKETIRVLGFVTLVVCIALPAFFFKWKLQEDMQKSWVRFIVCEGCS